MVFTIGTGLLLMMIIVVGFIAITNIYVRCPANKVLCVQGAFVGAGRSVRTYHGGAHLVFPLVQHSQFLDLTPMTITIPLKGALSQQNIRVNVPSTFTIAVDNSPDGMTNAAVRLLDLSQSEIESMAMEIIFGQLRLTIASLTIEEINQDRERFLAAIRNNIGPELQKIGLSLVNVNITDITDESGYIDAIGRKAASTALNQAKIDVAEQEKRGDIGAAEADKERRIRVAEYNSNAVEGENIAQANIASYNATLKVREAQARQESVVADQQAEAQIQKARASAEQERLHVEEVVTREIEKQKVNIDAEAEADKRRKEAEGEAAAILAVKNAEAEGIRQVLGAKAEGYHRMINACNDQPKDAATLLMVEKIEEVVELQTEAIKNIKIDKLTVWDSNGGEDGTATSKFMSNMIKSLPPLHDVARMAGVDLPPYLGEVVEHARPDVLGRPSNGPVSDAGGANDPPRGVPST